jgi:type I restriction enzyme S subunit
MFDGPHATPKLTQDGPVFLGIQSLSNGRLDLFSTKHVSETDFERWTRRVQPRTGDLVFSYETRLGEAALIPQGLRCCLGRRMGLLRRREGVPVVSEALLYAYLGDQFQAEIRKNTIFGSTVNRIPISQMHDFRIALPPLLEQRAIASVLGVLDDKIESNRRTANAASSVLRRVPPSSGEMSPLDQIAEFHNGGALTKHATGSGRPILRIKELRAGVTAETPRTDTPIRETHEVAGGDLLFSWSGTLLTTRWHGEPAVLNQHVFRVDPHPGFSRWFVEAWIEQHLGTFRAIAADKATTMGHIQRHHLSQALVALPPRNEMGALMRTYDPLDQLRMSLLAETQRLIAIRDGLLPRVMSGRLRVSLNGAPDEAFGTVSDEVSQPPSGSRSDEIAMRSR